ncbi:MAG: right-handed parallel beta-helix repeat-containing protein [Pseudomonadota bacterium]
MARILAKSLATLFWGLCLLCTAVAASAAETHRVAGAEALAALLAGPGVAGDTVILAPGPYPALKFSDKTAPAVLRSEERDAPARIAGLHLIGVRDMTLSGLVLDYRFADGDTRRTRPFVFNRCHNITLRDSRLEGDDARGLGPHADGFGIGIGLSIRDCDGVVLERIHISGFHRGMVVAQTRNVTLRASEVTDVRSDGINFVEVERVLIEGNRIHSFDRSLASSDHADLIQFWTNGTDSPSTDITIRGNLLYSGGGHYTQSIFMRNEMVDTGQAGPEMFYRNVLIEENVILNAHLHGITLGEATGVLIRRNTLAQNKTSAGESPDRDLWNPMIRVSPVARNVRIFENIAYRVVGHDGQRDWSVRDNFLAQNRSLLEPNHYNTLFAGFPKGDPRDPASYRYAADGPLAGRGVGAAMLAAR